MPQIGNLKLVVDNFDFSEEEKQKIAELRKLVENCKDLQIGTDDVLLTKFLYFARWDVQKAYEKIHAYYDFKANNPNWVASHPFEYFEDLLKNVKARYLLPRYDKYGRAIVINRMVDAFDKYPNYFYDLVELDDLLLEALLTTPNVQKNGITLIMDFAGINRKFMGVMTPTNSKMINNKNLVLPFTSRYVHFIQSGILMNAATALITPFLAKEIKETLFTHNGKNFDKLREMIGYENLPHEYGGPADYTLEDNNLAYEFIKERWDYLKNLKDYKKITD